jgi:hypothetical protein
MKRAGRRAAIRGEGDSRGILPSGYWILGPVWDLSLILLTPLLVLVVYLASLRLGLMGTFVLGGTILSVGHYLPGMMRAYGDPELFQRFPLRFSIVPLAFIVLCAGAAWVHLQALAFIGMCWGSWHWMKQIYGFGRIYDARAGSIDPATSRLDNAMCLVWFVWVGAVFNSTAAGHLGQLYASGISLVPEAAFAAFRTFWTRSDAGGLGSLPRSRGPA